MSVRAMSLLLLILVSASTGCCQPCRHPAAQVWPAVPRRVEGPSEKPPQAAKSPVVEEVDPVEETFVPPVPDIQEYGDGLVIPYPLHNPLRGYGKCRRGKRRHPAFDIGGVGPEGGLGTPVVSMVKARVTMIGRGDEDPGKFGRPDRRSGTAKRESHRYPRSMKVKGYGRVHFFTRNYGSWRSGTIIVTTALEGPLKGHIIRYMHLAAVHPDLKAGSIVEAGQEIGLMGGTAVQESAPHVHIDIADPEGKRLDVKAMFGLDEPHGPCN